MCIFIRLFRLGCSCLNGTGYAEVKFLWGLKCSVWGLGWGVWGLGCSVWGLAPGGCPGAAGPTRIRGLGPRVWGSGLGFGLGFRVRVCDLGFRV